MPSTPTRNQYVATKAPIPAETPRNFPSTDSLIMPRGSHDKQQQQPYPIMPLLSQICPNFASRARKSSIIRGHSGSDASLFDTINVSEAYQLIKDTNGQLHISFLCSSCNYKPMKSNNRWSGDGPKFATSKLRNSVE